MMGYNGYGNGGSYMSPSSSNLSASAPPFTLDRSPQPGSIPAVDFIEPSYSSPMNSSLNNWLPGCGPTSDLNPEPPPNNAYSYGGSTTVESSSFGQSVESATKKLPYYPPYLLPTTHKESSFVIPDQGGFDWSSSSRVSVAMDGPSRDYPRSPLDSKYGADWGDGSWKPLAEWKQSKPGHGSFCSREADVAVPSMYENYMNPDAKFPSGLSRGGDTSHTVDFMEIEKHSGSVKAESLNEKAFLGNTSSYTHVDYSRSVLGSVSGLEETRLRSASHQLPYTLSSEQHLKQRPGSVSSAPSFEIAYSVCDIKDFHSQSISGDKPAFDSSLIREHLERDDHSSLGLFYAKTEETFDTLHEALISKSGLRIPSSGRDRFSVDLNVNEALSSVQESSEGVDHYNHAVDSPCWKGVPVAHSSPFDSSEVVQDLKKLDATLNSNAEAKPNENTTGDKVGFLSRGSYSTAGDQKSDCAHSETNNLNAPVDYFVSSLNTSNEGPSAPTIDAPRLVNTIHNLSELLLFHCSRGSSQLLQKDAMAVQSVINNLGMCVPKITEKRVPIQEPTLSEKDYDYLGDLHKGFTVDQSQVTIGNKFDLDSLSARGDRDMVDEDKATKAFKKVLTENFNEDETQPETLLYKNLWLEAEAALCSVNYKARYNRMRVEMENSKLLKPKEAHEDTNPTTDAKKPLGSAVTPDSDAVETFSAPKARGLSVSSPSSHDDDVMARFRILRCRVENSNYGTPAAAAETNADKPSSSTASPRSGNISKTLVPEEKSSPKPESTPVPAVSSDSGKNKDISDFDASVMARFHILKSRGEDFTAPSETKLARFASQRTNWPIIGSIPEGGEIPEEGGFTMFGCGDDTEGQRSRSNGPYWPENSVVQTGYERVSPDWEHIRKEDLVWQSR